MNLADARYNRFSSFNSNRQQIIFLVTTMMVVVIWSHELPELTSLPLINMLISSSDANDGAPHNTETPREVNIC